MRMFVQLGQDELDGLICVDPGGEVVIDTEGVARRISRAVGLVGVRVGVDSLDYLQDEVATPYPSTRSASGIWWQSDGGDNATVGGFLISGFSMTVMTDGEKESPIVEDAEVVGRVTSAIAAQHAEATVKSPGWFEVTCDTGRKVVRLVVTRDHRLRRPQDLLDPEEVSALHEDEIAFVIVQLVGGGKALVFSQGL